jgi:hypothetical protein
MLRCVALVETDISEERIASIIRMKRIGDLGITLAVTINRSTLRRNAIANGVPSFPIVTLLMEAIRSSETSVITRDARRNFAGDGIILGLFPSSD